MPPRRRKYWLRVDSGGVYVGASMCCLTASGPHTTNQTGARSVLSIMDPLAAAADLTVTCPAAPSDNDVFAVLIAGATGGYKVTIQRAGAQLICTPTSKIGTSYELTTGAEVVELLYKTGTWYLL
jgi:hypothetical protein